MIQSETRGTGREAGGATRRPPGVAYWLISQTANGRIEVLTIDRNGEEALPVFSHEEEAETFLQPGDADAGWRTTESRAGGLVSVLYGPCARVTHVVLDPQPERVGDTTAELVSLPRERFVDRVLAAPARPREPARAG